MKTRKQNADKARELRQAVGDQLTAAMKKKKMTARQLIEASGINNLTRSSVSLYCNGRVLPARDRLESMLRACGEEITEEIEVAYHDAASGHLAQVGGLEAAKEFVLAWQSSVSVGEVATKMGITRQAAYSRAKAYRAKGVRLKSFSSWSQTDTDALNDIIDAVE